MLTPKGLQLILLYPPQLPKTLKNVIVLHTISRQVGMTRKGFIYF